MTTIKQLREKIDKIDALIIKKLAARQQLSKRIGQFKMKAGKKVIDLKREKQLIHAYQHLSEQYDLPATYIQRLFKIIRQYSRKLQRSARSGK